MPVLFTSLAMHVQFWKFAGKQKLGCTMLTKYEEDGYRSSAKKYEKSSTMYSAQGMYIWTKFLYSMHSNVNM